MLSNIEVDMQQHLQIDIRCSFKNIIIVPEWSRRFTKRVAKLCSQRGVGSMNPQAERNWDEVLTLSWSFSVPSRLWKLSRYATNLPTYWDKNLIENIILSDTPIASKFRFYPEYIEILGTCDVPKAFQKQGSFMDFSNLQYVQIIELCLYSKETTPNDQTDLATQENQAGWRLQVLYGSSNLLIKNKSSYLRNSKFYQI